MDEDLRRALRRVEPPQGFAERVLASTKSAATPKALRQTTSGAAPFRLAIAATLAVATIGGGLWYRAEERQRQQGEEAKRQVMQSLNIAGGKLHAIAIKVNHGEER
jgi:hypothetical protein